MKHWGPDIFKKPTEDPRCVLVIGEERHTFRMNPRGSSVSKEAVGLDKENLVPRGTSLKLISSFSNHYYDQNIIFQNKILSGNHKKPFICVVQVL